jgi:hypothetical protein
VSMEVLRALVGPERVKELPEGERRRLCQAIDAEILKDPQLTSQLLEVLKKASPHLASGSLP